MDKRTDLILKAAKEVAVKYIETGRLPLSSFTDAFETIYRAVDRMVPRPEGDPDLDGSGGQEKEADI